MWHPKQIPMQKQVQVYPDVLLCQLTPANQVNSIDMSLNTLNIFYKQNGLAYQEL